MSRSFSYNTQAVRVVFGSGALESLGDELVRLGVRRCVLVATPGRAVQVEGIRGRLGAMLVATFLDARVHVPLSSLQRLHEAVRHASADNVLALGGGSAIGFAKGIARDMDVTIAAVPTTYSGSEMTAIWGVTDGETKRTGRDPRVAPRLVVYDPVLSLGLSPRNSATSGLNAIAHCVEALYAPDATPISTMFAGEGLQLLARALPCIRDEPGNVLARHDALLGAHYAGRALDLTSMGLHHKLCHVLGGLGLPHAPTHAALLPYVVEFNAPAAPEAMELISRVFHSTDASAGLRALARRLGVSQSLRDLGLDRKDISRVAGQVASERFPNPRQVSAGEIEEILTRAW